MLDERAKTRDTLESSFWKLFLVCKLGNSWNVFVYLKFLLSDAVLNAPNKSLLKLGISFSTRKYSSILESLPMSFKWGSFYSSLPFINSCLFSSPSFASVQGSSKNKSFLSNSSENKESPFTLLWVNYLPNDCPLLFGSFFSNRSNVVENENFLLSFVLIMLRPWRNKAPWLF